MVETPQTILLIDDTEENIDIVIEILKDYDVIPATSGADAFQVLEEEHVDLILLDIVMPEMDGFEVCEKLKENPKTMHIPVIFLTAQTDEDSIGKAYDKGGVDYISKPFKPIEITTRIKVHLNIQHMIQELHFLATRDSLTGIYNRRRFFQRAQEIFDKEGNDIYAFMIDIDHFKKVNDTYGHHVGDIVLQEVTKAIGEKLDDTTIFGRIGGEEFALIMHANSTEGVQDKVNEILEFVAAQKIEAEGFDPISCTVSSGIAIRSEETGTLDDFFRAADGALYQAKDEGRNRSILRGSR